MGKITLVKPVSEDKEVVLYSEQQGGSCHCGT